MFNNHQDNRQVNLYDALSNSYKPLKEQDKFFINFHQLYICFIYHSLYADILVLSKIYN